MFNDVIPDDVLAELDGDDASTERAALNVIASTHSTRIMNGRILPVAAQDLAATTRRAFGNHLRPVTCVRWHAPDSEAFTASVLCAEDAVVNGRHAIDNALLPNLAEVAICDDGATSVSPIFGDLILDTTFLADGAMTSRQWLKPRADGSSQSQRIADSTP